MMKRKSYFWRIQLVFAAPLFFYTTISGATSVPDDRPSCVDELSDTDSFGDRMRAALTCQERVIGSRARSEALSPQEVQRVLQVQDEFRAKLNEFGRDGVFSNEERATLRTLRKQVGETIFELSNTKEDFDRRLENFNSRIQQGLQKSQLTQAEADALQAERAALQQALNAANADGVLTMEEKQALADKFREVSGKIYSDRRDDEGVAAATSDRSLDNVDERQRVLGGRVIHCYGREKPDGTPVMSYQQYMSLMDQQESIERLEGKYRSDGVLSREELDDLNAKLSELSQNIQAICQDRDRAEETLFQSGGGVDNTSAR